MDKNAVHFIILVSVCLAVCLAVVNLVFNVLVFEKTKDASTTTAPFTIHTAPPGTISKKPGFKAAADSLLEGLDLSIDPCDDFYAFSCNTFIRNNPEGTRSYDQTQKNINKAIAQSINSTSLNNSSAFRILKKVFDTCRQAAGNSTKDKTKEIYEIMKNKMAGFPMMVKDWKELTDEAMWKAIGFMELHHALPTLIESYVDVDYKNISRNALYMKQIVLSMTREYYVKPQFITQLNEYHNTMIKAMKQFKKNINSEVDDAIIEAETTKAIEMERFLAVATMPQEEQRNHAMLYNSYNLTSLQSAFPKIHWNAYFSTLLENVTNPAESEYIVQMPTYFATLNTFIEGSEYSKKTFVNYLMMKFVEENVQYLGNGSDSYTKLYQIIRAGNGQPTDWNPVDDSCVSLMEKVMPFASGYAYLKTINQTERDAVRKDVLTQLAFVIEAFLKNIKTMKWITPASLNAANKKAEGLVKNIGWPEWFDFSNTIVLDRHYESYSSVLNISDWWNMLEALHYSYQLTENIGTLKQKPERSDFHMSPALFNAWYQPSMNSITFPYAAFNPPSYGYGYPQAYNYAGQGSLAGHELTHAFDDEGVQFNGVGELSPCKWDHCGWLDTNSTRGFNTMAQCVVSQYSQHCCPLKTGSVRCASGIHTQGENIADIGGLLAAYDAYQQYVKVELKGVQEDRLPGLEQFSLNQIFWITYAFTWCEHSSYAKLVRQLLTNPHSPSVCRVNQVVRDIPHFGKDFGCKSGSPMYPHSNERCFVWTGQ